MSLDASIGTANDPMLESIAPMNALPVGTRLQEFIIRSVVGEGGFGIVYLAHDTLLGREVAIKEYLPSSLAVRIGGTQVDVRVAAKRELFNKGMRRFVNEAHILARFRHPALVAVLRFMEANGTAYMVMPYYRGKTLRELVRAGYRTQSTEDLFAILLPVLEALTQIHSVECFHLDISSDNILLLENKVPVLLDFGAARHTELNDENPTTIILKPGFAPIEQYGNDDSALLLGPWTDIYALSVVAYQLVSGSMPGVSVSRIVRDNVKPLTEFATPALPAEVLQVVDLGMSVKPNERPQSAAAYVEALLNATDSFVPSSPPSEPGPGPSPDPKPVLSFVAPPPIPIRWDKALLRWGTLVALLVVFMAVFFSILSLREDRAGKAGSVEHAGARLSAPASEQGQGRR